MWPHNAKQPTKNNECNLKTFDRTSLRLDALLWIEKQKQCSKALITVSHIRNSVEWTTDWNTICNSMCKLWAFWLECKHQIDFIVRKLKQKLRQNLPTIRYFSVVAIRFVHSQPNFQMVVGVPGCVCVVRALSLQNAHFPFARDFYYRYAPKIVHIAAEFCLSFISYQKLLCVWVSILFTT